MTTYTELEYQIYLKVLRAKTEEEAKYRLRSRLENFSDFDDEQIEQICKRADYEDFAVEFMEKMEWDNASADDVWAWIMDDFIDYDAEYLLEEEDDD